MPDATAMQLATAQDLYETVMQHSVTGDRLKGREGEHWAPLCLLHPVSGRFGQMWRFALQTEIKGRGLDGIVVGLKGGMVVKVNKLHPGALKQCSTEECRRSMEAESEERFKNEVNYLLKNQNCPFVVPVFPVVYVEYENSQRLGYLMPELKSADKVPPSESMAIQVVRELLAILCFFRENKVVYSDFKPQNLLLQELPGGVFEVKLNDFGFVGTVGGEFQGGTDTYMHPDYLLAKFRGLARGAHVTYPPLDYKLDTYAFYRIVFDAWGYASVSIDLSPEVVNFQGLKWCSRAFEEMELGPLGPDLRHMMEEVLDSFRKSPRSFRPLSAPHLFGSAG